MALPDLPLTFCITLAIWAALVSTLESERSPRKFVLLAALGLGLGFLMKGPVGLIIPLLVIVPVLAIERRSIALTPDRHRPRVRGDAGGAMPWYLLMWMRHGNEYLQGFFVGDNFERFATDRFNDPRPWWFYLPGGRRRPAAVDAAGAGVARPDHAVPSAASRRRHDRFAVDAYGPLLPLVFYTLSVGKQPRYVLPVLPPLALAAGRGDRRAHAGMARLRGRPLDASPRAAGGGRFVLERRVSRGAGRAAVSRAAAADQRAADLHDHRGDGDRGDGRAGDSGRGVAQLARRPRACSRSPRR